MTSAARTRRGGTGSGRCSWPLRETVRKMVRTFSTALRLMEEYPEYKFGVSQPQVFQMIKGHDPRLYKRDLATVIVTLVRTNAGANTVIRTDGAPTVVGYDSFVEAFRSGKPFQESEDHGLLTA